MSTLREAAEQYLQLRRNLGYKLREAGRLLQNFVAFAEREGASHVTTDLALRWAQQPSGVQPATWASRLRVVRRFAVWLSASDRRTEVPPAGLLPGRYRPEAAVHLQRRGDQGSRPGSRSTRFGRRAEGPHLRDDLRIARGHRHARQRSGGTRSGGRGSGGRNPADSADEVRQVSARGGP